MQREYTHDGEILTQASREKLDRAERWNTPTITAREFLALI